jgi:hypothetical protein
MILRSSLIAIYCFLSAPLFAAAPWDFDNCPRTDFIMDVNLQGGYRCDSFRWNTGLRHGPNILSELQWKNLDIAQVGGECILEYPNLFYMRVSGYYGRAWSGEVWDSDFELDDRAGIFDRSVSDAKGSTFVDITAGVGKLFHHPDGCFTIAPMVGYSVHTQPLLMGHGINVLYNYEFDNHSHFTTEWQSVWAGVDMTIPTTTPWEFRLSYEVHYVFYYRGTGHWKLRLGIDFFDDFRQESDGIGQVAMGAACYRITDCFDINFMVKIQDFITFSGKQHMFCIDPDNHRHQHVKICLNEARWISGSAMLGANFSF